jgi:hypothetical protein
MAAGSQAVARRALALDHSSGAISAETYIASSRIDARDNRCTVSSMAAESCSTGSTYSRAHWMSPSSCLLPVNVRFGWTGCSEK